MRSLFPAAVLTVAALAAPSFAAASDTATSVVVVSANFGSRTSLKVSTELLQFDVTAPGQPASVAVTFSAGARTQTGGEVVLSVEASRAIDGPGGAADVETALSFSGEGDGTLGGPVHGHAPTRCGTLDRQRPSNRAAWCSRSVPGAPGVYSVPVHFVLESPRRTPNPYEPVNP